MSDKIKSGYSDYLRDIVERGWDGYVDVVDAKMLSGAADEIEALLQECSRLKESLEVLEVENDRIRQGNVKLADSAHSATKRASDRKVALETLQSENKRLREALERIAEERDNPFVEAMVDVPRLIKREAIEMHRIAKEALNE